MLVQCLKVTWMEYGEKGWVGAQKKMHAHGCGVKHSLFEWDEDKNNIIAAFWNCNHYQALAKIKWDTSCLCIAIHDIFF